MIADVVDITKRKQWEEEQRIHTYKLEQLVELRTQNLNAANQELTAVNQELTAMNQEMAAMNETLQDAIRKLEDEVVIRQQKEQELSLREKQYRAATSLLTGQGKDFDGFLKSILQDAVKLVGAHEGYIGFFGENGKKFSIGHEIGAIPDFYQTHLKVAVDQGQGIIEQVRKNGEVFCEKDYRSHPLRIPHEQFDRVASLIMVPLKQGDIVRGVLAVVWIDAVQQLAEEHIEVVRQFGSLASIALERAYIQEKVGYQNQLLKGLAETTTALVDELDMEKVLQRVLEQAAALMEIPHGFIQLFDPDGIHANTQCTLGRHVVQAGKQLEFAGKGILAEIVRTGKLVVIEDYAHWPNRLPNSFYDEATLTLQAPLIVGGKTIGSIGLTSFGEQVSVDQEKLSVLEQFACVASIAIKNAMTYQDVEYKALHDSLTGLPNRERLSIRLAEEREKMCCENYGGAVLFIDLDDLKLVNDSFGHSCGDNIIKSVAENISAAIGPTGFLARVGGDEFVIVLPGEFNRQHITKIADGLVCAIHREYEVSSRKIHMSASLGVALYPEDGKNGEELIKNADIAMYSAKTAGKNWLFYEPVMQTDAYDKMVMTNDLRHALERGELYLNYQPQIALRSGEVVGFEALLRWNSPEHGLVPPNRFIPLAEQSRLILPIGQFVIAEACRFARKLADMGRRDVHVAVNVSPRQLSAEDFVETVCFAVEEAGIHPEQLEVEVTESVLIDSLENSTRKLNELCAIGVKLSLDDFGTGYSSLTYLRCLPVESLKIDKSFIDKVLDDNVQEGFIRSIIDMAHVLGLNVVAEGVETELQRRKLTQLHCDLAQGYVFSKPVSEAKAIEFLVAGR